VEIQPAGSAKAQTLSQPSKLLQLWKRNIRKVSEKENVFRVQAALAEKTDFSV
jgi:hypothetical protein